MPSRDRQKFDEDAPGIIAMEHVLWCARNGMNPAEVMDALHESCPQFPTWGKAVEACTREYAAIQRQWRRAVWHGK